MPSHFAQFFTTLAFCFKIFRVEKITFIIKPVRVDHNKHYNQLKKPIYINVMYIIPILHFTPLLQQNKCYIRNSKKSWEKLLGLTIYWSVNSPLPSSVKPRHAKKTLPNSQTFQTFATSLSNTSAPITLLVTIITQWTKIITGNKFIYAIGSSIP